MPVQHSALTASADLHEPKGAPQLTGGASDKHKVYKSDGAGSGTWAYKPHAYFEYSNIGTGTTITAPTTYTVIAPTTTGDSNAHDFTHSGSARLTYTGLDTLDFDIHVGITFKHSAGAGVDCYFEVLKNGTTLLGIEAVQTADSANYGHTSLIVHDSLAQNDYIEVFCKCASGNIVVHAMSVSVKGLW